MIPVEKQLEPSGFKEKVTDEAFDFLKENPTPTLDEIRKENHWTNIRGDLHKAYQKRCAYSALYCPLSMTTVDHYIPLHALVNEKPPNPGGAYDWNNFRLASWSMNRLKNKFRDVLDPFDVQWGWFEMHFPSLLITPGPDLAPELKEKVEATIKRLKLNDSEEHVEARRDFLVDYCTLCKDPDSIESALAHLERKAPFMAYELKRLKLTEKIIHMFKVPEDKDS